MWGIYAFQESIDEAGVYTELAAVPDQTTKAIGDYIYVPKTNKLCNTWSCLGATSPGQPYIDSPSLRRQHVHYLMMNNNFVVAEFSYFNDHDIYNPITLSEGEGIKYMSNANPAAAEVHTAILMMSDAVIVPVKGEIFNLYFTSAITGVIGAWVSGNITLSQDLPVGNYSIVGLKVASANCVASRLIFNTQMSRPGVLATAILNSNVQPEMLNGYAGVYGSFHSLTPPQLEILVRSTCTAQAGYLQLIRT